MNIRRFISSFIVVAVIVVMPYSGSCELKLIDEQAMAAIVGQSGFSVSPFPGFDIQITDDGEDQAECDNDDDCKENDEGGTFNFQLFTPGSTMSGFQDVPVHTRIQPNVFLSPPTAIQAMPVEIISPLETLTVFSTAFSGGFF